jgi:beta-lactam-binding protein with PASTA domain
MSQIWQKIRRIGLEIYCFLTAPFVVKNCLGMVTFVGLLFMLTIWWLKCYTNHGESIEVPQITGLNYREALRAAKSSNLDLAVTDSLYLEGKAPGEVLSQNPKAKSHVKEGRTIYITIVKSSADMVTLPNLASNDDYEMYARQCSRMNVKTRISARVPSSKLEPNVILAVIHRADTITNLLRRGHKVEMGSILDFVVTEPVSADLSVPELVCMTFDEAKFLLSNSPLTLGQVIKDATVTNTADAYVWKQQPAPSTTGIVPGQTIDLYLTQEAPQGCR